MKSICFYLLKDRMKVKKGNESEMVLVKRIMDLL
jgi:hypothetical protein